MFSNARDIRVVFYILLVYGFYVSIKTTRIHLIISIIHVVNVITKLQSTNL